MKKIFIYRFILWLILGAISFIIAFREIEPIQFSDLFSIFGLEISLISLSTLLVINSKFDFYVKKSQVKATKLYLQIFKQTFHIFMHTEILLVNILFFLYVFKAYDFNSQINFLILIFSIYINNIFLISFHLFILHFYKMDKKKKVLNNSFIVITFIIVMTNLPIINNIPYIKEFLYYFPLPGAFLLPINPDVNFLSPLLLVSISLVLLPFVLLFNYRKKEINSD